MSRELMLARIRKSLNRNGPLPQGVADGLARRTAGSRPHVLPDLQADPLARFEQKLGNVAASVAHCTAGTGISDAVCSWLDDNGLPMQLVSARDELLDEVPWSNRLEVRNGLPDSADPTSLTVAVAAVAETGSIVMLSDPRSPTSLNLLPDNHIVAVPRERLVRHQEEVWTLLRQRDGGMPRTVNFITGPSRTADVEQVLQLGAHGPRRFHVLLVED